MNDSIYRDLAILAEKEILQKVSEAMRSDSGPKRWFWELLQNAADTISKEPDRKVNVKVVLKQREGTRGATMTFEHDGNGFLESSDPNKFDDFKNLILPRSNKDVSDNDKIGKFGTGFLSTHNLSLKIDVSGGFKELEGEEFSISTTLDRTYFMDDRDENRGHRVDSIIQGLKNYTASLEAKAPVVKNGTSFTYYLNDEPAIKRVKTGLLDIEKTLTTVMMLNSKIGLVQIENHLDSEFYEFVFTSSFKKEDLTIFSCQKRQNGSFVQGFSVAALISDELTLSWPIEYCSEADQKITFLDARKEYMDSVMDEMPILHCTFPLIGSHKLKLPVVIHSKKFKPNEKRDGISLTDKIQTKDDGEEVKLDLANKILIESTIPFFEKFLENASRVGDNLFHISKVKSIPKADWISEDWYKPSILEPVRKIVLSKTLIRVNDGTQNRKSIIGSDGKPQLFFPATDQFKEGTDNDLFYDCCDVLFPNMIPVKGELDGWHSVLWTEQEKIRILKIEDIVQEVSEKNKSLTELSAFLKQDQLETIKWLNGIYKLVNLAEKPKLLEQYAVTPNLNGDFRISSLLRRESEDSKIDDQIIALLKELSPSDDFSQTILHREIDQDFFAYQPVSLKNDVSPRFNEVLNLKDGAGGYVILTNKNIEASLRKLLSFCSAGESTDSEKKKIFNNAKDIFGQIEEQVLENYGDFNLDTTKKLMVRLINKAIENSVNVPALAGKLGKHEVDCITWLNDYLNLIINSHLLKDLIHTAKIIPNQNKEFLFHGKEGEVNRVYKPYKIESDKKSEVLNKGLIKSLKEIDTKIDWASFLVLDGVELSTLPTKNWVELSETVDSTLEIIAKRVVSDSAEEAKKKYQKPVLEILDWWYSVEFQYFFNNKFSFLRNYADKLYSTLTYTPEIGALMRDPKKLAVAKRIGQSSLSASEVEKTLNKVEEIREKYGEKAVDEFLRRADEFMTNEQEFEGRLELGKTIENLVREAIQSEGLAVSPVESNGGAYDILVSKNEDPSKNLKLEVKSYKNGTSYDFKFAIKQIRESKNDTSNFIVCTLERPNSEDADVTYIKQNLHIHKNLFALNEAFYNDFEVFESIYNQSKSGQIPLEIPTLGEPRVKVKKGDLMNSMGGYDDLIESIRKWFS